MVNRNRECPFERQVREAIAAGTLTEELKQHATGCSECAETLFVMSELRSLGGTPEPSVQEFEIQRILLKARLQREARGASKLRLLLNGLVLSLLFIGLGAAAFVDWSKIENLLAGSSPLPVLIAAIVLVLLVTQELETGDIA
ncbi:MAG TPA: hypothetical protein VMS71_08245 [Candidatus Acidoferrum sp.]|nr:hypothetical protein [Candidatus Acidoferrum sp.]